MITYLTHRTMNSSPFTARLHERQAKWRACLCVSLLLYFACAIIFPSEIKAGAQPEQLHSYLRQGIEKTFNLEFPEATGSFRKRWNWTGMIPWVMPVWPLPACLPTRRVSICRSGQNTRPRCCRTSRRDLQRRKEDREKRERRPGLFRRRAGKGRQGPLGHRPEAISDDRPGNGHSVVLPRKSGGRRSAEL